MAGAPAVKQGHLEWRPQATECDSQAAALMTPGAIIPALHHLPVIAYYCSLLNLILTNISEKLDFM